MSIPRKEPQEIIESVGIEMEFCNINRSDRQFQQKVMETLRGYKTEHDASVESPIRTFLNYPVVLSDKAAIKRLAPFLGRLTIGGEIISPIRNSNSPDWVVEIENLCDILLEYGETEDTVRDSFHVHVNITKDVPLFVIKNILQFTLSFEALLFRLGGMGRPNRGVTNDYIFSRPYLGNGPPVINQGRRNYPIINPDHLMNTTDKVDFFVKYGDAYYLSGRAGKYVTPRYMSINFYPILTQGSLEFRTANKTLNSRYIIAWTNFCKAIISKSFSDRQITINGLFPLAENRDIPTREFIHAIEILGLDNATMNVLLEIWETSPVPLFDNVWRYSHLPQPTIFNTDYLPEPLDVKIKVEKARHIDIHGLENQIEMIEHEGEIGFRPDALLGRHDPLRRPRNVRRFNNPNFEAIGNEVFGNNNVVNIGAAIPAFPENPEVDIWDDELIVQTNRELSHFLGDNFERYGELIDSTTIPINLIPLDMPFYNFSVVGFLAKILRDRNGNILLTYNLPDFEVENNWNIPMNSGEFRALEGVLNLTNIYEMIRDDVLDNE